MLSTFDVLSKLAEDWKQMTEAEQSNVALTIGMKTQIDVLSATLLNFDSALEATKVAQNSAGSAMRENEAFTQSLQYRINMLKAEFQELVLGDGGLTSFIKLLVDAGTTILKFANSDVGQLIIKTTLLVTSLNLLNKGFKTLASSKIGVTIQLFNALAQSSLGLSGALQITGETILSTAKTWAVSPFGTATIVVGSILLLKDAFDAFNVTLEEQQDKLREVKSDYESISSSMDSTDEELKKINDKIEEINSLNGAQTARDGELEKLLTQKQELENILAIQQESYRLKQKELEEEARKTVKKAVVDEDAFGTIETQEGTAYKSGDRVQAVINLSDKMNDLNSTIEEQKTKLADLAKEQKGSTDEYKSLEESITKNEEEYDRLSKKASDYANALREEREGLDENSELYQYVQSALDSLGETYINTDGNIKKGNEGLEDSNDVLQDYADALDMTIEELLEAADEAGMTAEEFAQLEIIEDLNEKFNDSVSSLDELQSAYNTLSGAVDEYNSSGSLSLDTVTNLLSLGSEYLSLLQFENGQLSINEAGVIALANARIDEAQALAIEEAQAQLAALANGTLAEQEGKAGDQAVYAGQTASQAGQLALQSGQDALAGASGWNQFYSALAGGQGVSGDLLNSELSKEIESTLQNRLSSLESIRDKIGKTSVSSAKKSGGSAGKAAGDAYLEAYKKELAALEHDKEMEVISTKEFYDKLEALNEKYFGEATGQHEKYLDEYQKNEEKIYKGRKDLLEEQKSDWEDFFDFINDQYDQQIENLEKQRDLILEGRFGYGGLEGEKEELEEELEYWEDYYDEKIELLEKAHDAEIEKIENQEAELEAARDEAEKYWDEQIENYKKANEELDKNIQLQEKQEALDRAKSQKVRIFKDGKFQFGQNEAAVEEAEQDLIDYQEQLKREEELQALENARDEALGIYDKQLDDLNKYKEEQEKIYEEQLAILEEQLERKKEYYEQEIEDLEEHIEEVKKYYDIQIQLVEEQQEKFETSINEYEESQKRKKYLQLTGLQDENNIFQQSLKNLAAYVSEYNRIQNELGSGNENVTSHYQGVSSVGESQTSIPSYAKGAKSIGKDEIAVVGENPNQELVIGSRVNGSLMKLEKGSGVVNSNSTNTLARNLNELAKYNRMGMFENSYQTTRNDTSNIQSFNFDNLVLPNVTNGNEFIQELQNYKNYIIQTVNSGK